MTGQMFPPDTVSIECVRSQFISVRTDTHTVATGWANCEFRSYQFVDPTGQDEDAALRETEESFQRRRGDIKAPTQTEQRELRPVVLEQMSPYLNIKN